MPNSLVSAKGGPLPALTRRSLLVGGFAATALAPDVPVSAHTTHSDAHLTALGVRFEQALATHHAAQCAFNDCERRYLEDCPDPPPILTSAGALGKLLNHEGSWWRARELRWLMKDEDHRDAWPDAGTALPVALAYEARERRFKRKIGLRAAESAHEAAIDALDELGAPILAAPPRSPAAFALKGRVVKAWGKPEWWSAQASHADIYERLAAEIIDKVIASAA